MQTSGTEQTLRTQGNVRKKVCIRQDLSPSPTPAHGREEEKQSGGGGGSLELLNTEPWRSALGAETYTVWCSGHWGAQTGGVLERQTVAICGGGDPHPAVLGQGKDRRFERLPSNERAAEGVGFAWNLLRRGGESWTRLSGRTLPSWLGALTSFRHPIPLAANSAPRSPTVTRSLLHLPPGLPALVRKLAITVLVSGQPEGGLAYNSYRCKAQRLTPEYLAH